jgi:hypothetical protein
MITICLAFSPVTAAMEPVNASSTVVMAAAAVRYRCQLSTVLTAEGWPNSADPGLASWQQQARYGPAGSQLLQLGAHRKGPHKGELHCDGQSILQTATSGVLKEHNSTAQRTTASATPVQRGRTSSALLDLRKCVNCCSSMRSYRLPGVKPVAALPVESLEHTVHTRQQTHTM